MPSLNLRNPLRRDPNRPTLKQRAATLKATAARLIRRPKRLPAAGSPEALAAFSAACRFVDAASRSVDAEVPTIAPGLSTVWTSDKVMAAQVGNFSGFLPREVEAARAVPRARLEELLVLTLRRELRMAEAAKISRIRELHALVYGDEPGPDDGSEAPATDKEVDWHSPPPGFMASPAIDPYGFTHIEGGIRIEAERLLGIALAEMRRRRANRSEHEDEATRLAEDARLTKKFHINALASITSPEHIESTDWRYVSDSVEEAPALRLAEDANADLIVLGQRFDTLHAAWREAEEAGKEPAARREAALAAARSRRGAADDDHRAAWTLPGVTEAHDRTEKAFSALEPIMDEIAARPARTVQGLAVKVRALIPAVWPCGNYEQDAALGEGEDWDGRIARQIIESCCAAAGVDWRGQPLDTDPAFAGFPDADAELIALGRVFDAAASKSGSYASGDDDEVSDIAGDEAEALARRIAALRAHTVEGMRAKLRVAAFYQACDHGLPAEEGYLGEAAIRSLYRDTPGIEIGTDPAEVRIVPEA